MLILSRRSGESIRVGDDIEITILNVNHNKVKIGIRSPRHIPIYREELYRKIQAENLAAACPQERDTKIILESLKDLGSKPSDLIRKATKE